MGVSNLISPFPSNKRSPAPNWDISYAWQLNNNYAAEGENFIPICLVGPPPLR